VDLVTGNVNYFLKLSRQQLVCREDSDRLTADLSKNEVVRRQSRDTFAV
jgi:hypothetical protein